MNFFGKEINVVKVEDQFYVNMEGILVDELAKTYQTSSGISLDELLPLMASLPETGWGGLYRRELIRHVVLDRTFNVGDMSIPQTVDVEFDRRFRLSTYRENDRVWVCAVQLEQAAHGIHYDLRVACSLKPSLKNSVMIPFRPRLVWQNDREMVVYFIPLEYADRYFKFLRTDLTALYVDKHAGKIQDRVNEMYEQNIKWF